MLSSGLRRRNAVGIVGFVIVHMERIASEWRAYVVTLDVAPEYRRQGLAQRSDERGGDARGRRQERGGFSCMCLPGTQAAIRFYERMGYERIRVRRGFYGARGSGCVCVWQGAARCVTS